MSYVMTKNKNISIETVFRHANIANCLYFLEFFKGGKREEREEKFPFLNARDTF